MEKSPYFETMSKVLVKRGFLFKKEFVSIGRWKSQRQINNYEANDEDTIQPTSTSTNLYPSDCKRKRDNYQRSSNDSMQILWSFISSNINFLSELWSKESILTPV